MRRRYAVIPLAIGLGLLALVLLGLYVWLIRFFDRDLERRLNRLVWPLWDANRRLREGEEDGPS